LTLCRLQFLLVVCDRRYRSNVQITRCGNFTARNGIVIRAGGVTGGGADRPGWHHPGGDALMKVKFFCGWILQSKGYCRYDQLEGGEGGSRGDDDEKSDTSS